MKNRKAILLATAMILVIGVTARAFINPNFTPKDLEKDSELILLLEFKNADDAGKAVATVKKVLKGDCKDKELTFDLLAMAEPVQAAGKQVMATIAGGDRQALLFVGKFQAEGTGLEGGGGKVAGLLHNGGRWSVMSLADKTWEMEKREDKMLGTFSGSTDMLVRCMTYVMTDPNAEVPVEEKVDWAGKIPVGKTDRKINAVAAVDLAGDGKLAAFLASDAGDQIYRWNGKTMEDVTSNWRFGRSPRSSLGATSTAMGSSPWQAGTASNYPSTVSRRTARLPRPSSRPATPSRTGASRFRSSTSARTASRACWLARRPRPWC